MAATTFELGIFWNIVKEVFQAISGKTTATIEAHRLIHRAFIKTYDYLRTHQANYTPQAELAELWNDAAAAVMKIDYNLGQTLHIKSRFWTDPELFFDLKRESEVITLNRVIDEMDRLRVGLHK